MNAPVNELNVEEKSVVVRVTAEQWKGLEFLDCDLYLEACGLQGFVRLAEIALLNDPEAVLEEIDTILRRAKVTADNIHHMIETRLDSVMQRVEHE